MALAFTGDKLPAAQAKEWGLIWDVAEDPWPPQRPWRSAWRPCPPGRWWRRGSSCVRASTRTLNQQLDAERDMQSALGHTHDYFEGVAAFLEKRPAVFKGE
jgi:2-(1,2-epoxy-1,2-dihydrophenyl)acetyl-CoA isomerase